MTKSGLNVRVVPNARRSEVCGEHGGAIKLKVASPALEGKANDAVVELIAETTKVSLKQVHIVAGLKSRDKVVVVDGMTPEEVRAQLLGASSSK